MVNDRLLTLSEKMTACDRILSDLKELSAAVVVVSSRSSVKLKRGADLLLFFFLTSVSGSSAEKVSPGSDPTAAEGPTGGARPPSSSLIYIYTFLY